MHVSRRPNSAIDSETLFAEVTVPMVIYCESIYHHEHGTGLLPHASERWERHYFQRCVSVHGGTPWSLVPGSFPGLWSQVLCRGYTSPVISPIQSPVLGPAWGEGVPQSCYWFCPESCPRSCLGRECTPTWDPHPLDMMGYPPSNTAQEEDGCAARAVCLLRYLRTRTFLFCILSAFVCVF